MKKSIETILSLSLFGLLLFTLPAYAHHPAADIVDAELYAIIDELVSAPHADLVFDDNMGGGDTMRAITGSLALWKSWSMITLAFSPKYRS